jgi:hypothetical protein
MNAVAKTAQSSQKARKARCALQQLGSIVVAFGLAIAVSGPAQALNIVQNGGFETGTFAGWTQGGNTGFSGVECPGAAFVAEGNCDAFFGPVGSTGTLSQVLNTIIGQHYLVSFALRTDGGTTSLFSASLGAVSLITLTNPPATAYHLLSFDFLATSATTLLAFNFRDDPGFVNLDAVSVSIPEPGTMALLGIGVIGLLLGRRKTQ